MNQTSINNKTELAIKKKKKPPNKSQWPGGFIGDSIEHLETLSKNYREQSQAHSMRPPLSRSQSQTMIAQKETIIGQYHW